jgi:predicted MFS family arabinose efflux permease
MNLRFFVPLLLTAFFEQTCASMVRVTITYRTVELGLSPLWIGIITTVFAVLPLFMALQVGRFIDRGNDAKTAWIGGGLMLLACLGFALWHSLTGLLVATALLGCAHLLLVISQQVLCTRHAGSRGTESAIGNYMVANAVGQAVGPAIVGWMGGDASIPPTLDLFMLAVPFAALTFFLSFALPPGPPVPPRAKNSKPMSVGDIARQPGLTAIFMVSVVTVVAQDLIVVYLPLLGSERGLSVDTIGWLLTVRAIASMSSRFLFYRINILLGRWRLIVSSTTVSAITYAAIALPLPLFLMHVAIAFSGFALALAVTGSIAGVLALSPPGSQGTANSLRMTGNRLGQLIIPFAAGALATASGAGAIFVIIGTSLAGSAAAVQFGRKSE